MHLLALLGQREGKHLDLGELVHAIKPTRCAAGGTRFGAEAVADAAHLQRQLFRFEHLARVQSTEGDLRCGDEIQIEVLDRVNLRLRAAGNKANPLQDVTTGHVGSDRGNEPFAHQKLHRVLLERKFQQSAASFFKK